VRPVVLFALLTACAPSPRWSDTRALCGFEPAPLDRALTAVFPSEACVDRVLDDLDADRDALLAADGLSDPYGLVWGEDLEGTATGALLSSAHALLTVDLGTRASVNGRWATPAFRGALDEVARHTGAQETSALLYDYVAHAVHRTTSGEREGALAGLHRRTLFLYDLPFGIDGAAILVHEARHDEGPDHVWCNGEAGCDSDPTGSYGFQMAVHEIARDATRDPWIRKIEQSWMDQTEHRILGR
jgi:hypothetical protein